MRLASSALLPAILLQLTTRDLQLLCALAWLHCPLICVELFTESWEQLLLNCLLRGSGDDWPMRPVGVLNTFGLKEEMWLCTEVLCTSVGSLASERMLNLLLRSISYEKRWEFKLLVWQHLWHRHETSTSDSFSDNHFYWCQHMSDGTRPRSCHKLLPSNPS